MNKARTRPELKPPTFDWWRVMAVDQTKQIDGARQLDEAEEGHLGACGGGRDAKTAARTVGCTDSLARTSLERQEYGDNDFDPLDAGDS